MGNCLEKTWISVVQAASQYIKEKLPLFISACAHHISYNRPRLQRHIEMFTDQPLTAIIYRLLLAQGEPFKPELGSDGQQS